MDWIVPLRDNWHTKVGPLTRARWRMLVLAVPAVLITGLVAVVVDDGEEAATVVAAGGSSVIDARIPPMLDLRSARAATTTSTAQPPSTTTSSAAPPAPPAAGAIQAAPPQDPVGPFGPISPGTLAFAPEPGRTTWAGVSNGITLTLSVSTGVPVAGQPVRFTGSATVDGQPCCSMNILFGDGASWNGGGDCDPPHETIGTRHGAVDHVYNRAGRWPIMLDVGSCGAYGAIQAWLDVAPGAPPSSQGPAPPVIELIDEYRDPQQPVDPSFLQIYIRAHDDDGWISQFIIEWNDGNPQTVVRRDPSVDCIPTPGGWPARTLAWTPTNPPPSHHFDELGGHQIVATVVSSACDGSGEQRTTVVFQWSPYDQM